MTVRDFIKWLETQDQEAVVRCLKHDRSGSYYEQGGTCAEADFEPTLSDYVDFRGNQWVTSDSPCYGKRFLLIGESE